jgi:hypothetical protein
MHALARRRPPRHFLEGVSIALAWAGYFASLDWWRPAVAAAALGTFGLWAVCDRLVRRNATGWRRVLATVARGAAATVTAVAVGLLLLELFLRVVMGSSPIS